MKNKTTMLVMLALMQVLVTYAQHNPTKEILVFFKEGVQQESKIVNGRSLKSALVTSDRLKTSLKDRGIEPAMLEVAMPSFKEKDTVKILPDGRVISRPNMSKLYRLRVNVIKLRICHSVSL